MTSAVLVILLAAALLLLVLACMRIESLYRSIEHIRAADHDEFLQAVIKAVGDRHEVNVLRLAAIDYASVLGQERAREVAQQFYSAGGAPVASLWLNDRADKIEEEM